jgi:hypothetical protein
MKIARNYTDTDLKFEKQRFLKVMPTIKKRAEYKEKAALIGGNIKMIEG